MPAAGSCVDPFFADRVVDGTDLYFRGFFPPGSLVVVLRVQYHQDRSGPECFETALDQKGGFGGRIRENVLISAPFLVLFVQTVIPGGGFAGVDPAFDHHPAGAGVTFCLIIAGGKINAIPVQIATPHLPAVLAD